MSIRWKRVPTVRPRSAARAPLSLCLLAFALTAVIVYRWGCMSWTPADPNPTYTATAYVTPPSAGQHRIPFQCTDGDRQRAARMANDSAKSYISQRCAERQRRTEEPPLAAQQAAEKARREYAQAVAELENFHRQLAGATETQSDGPTQQTAPAMIIDNPQWATLDHELTNLQRQLDQLLVDRTPAHPAVQELATRISGVKNQLAVTPRQISRSQPEAAETIEPSFRSAPKSPSIAKADQEKLDQLAAAVERSRQACEEAEAAPKNAVAERPDEPQFLIESAQVVTNPPAPDFGWLRLICTTLAASTVMAFGVGSMSLGTQIEPVVAGLAEVEADAGVAVVGLIPSDDPAPDAGAASGRQTRARRRLLAIGLILIAACPLVAAWGVAGIN